MESNSLVVQANSLAIQTKSLAIQANSLAIQTNSLAVEIDGQILTRSIKANDDADRKMPGGGLQR
jgi:hypothetical protein